MAKVYERECVAPFEVTVQNGDHFALVVGKTYTVSGVRPDGMLIVFSQFWVSVPASCFTETPAVEPERLTDKQRVTLLESQLAARDATIERLKAALHPGPMPVSDREYIYRDGEGVWRGLVGCTDEGRLWRYATNRYEQLTGEKSDG